MAATILGWLATAISIIFLIPQIIKIIKSKSARDLSLITSFITMIIDISWGIYGILSSLIQVYVTDLTVAALALILIIYQLIWRKNNKEEVEQQSLKRKIAKMPREELVAAISKIKAGEEYEIR
jgi:MtN3 and saliva related transmembrane protein